MEFALVIGVLVLIVGGIIEFGRVFWHYDTLTKATRDGARLMSQATAGTLHSIAEGDANQVVLVEAAAAQIIPALTSSQVVIQCTYLAGSTEGAWGNCHDMSSTNPMDVPVHVRVSISGNPQYTVPLAQWFPMPGAAIALRPQTTMRYVHNN